MTKTKLTALRKVFSALAMVLAITVFTGSNSVAFAAATKPEPAASAAPDEFKPPKLTVVWDDADGEDLYKPQVGAMGYEKAAQIGAQYLWEMFGESIDGKAVRMLYMASRPSFTRDYWYGQVYNTKADINYDRYTKDTGNKSRPLFTFEIDAATGEWVSIGKKAPAQPKREGRGKTMTLEEEVALALQPPAQLDKYIISAKAFAQKHFKKTKVVGVEFMSQKFDMDKKSNDEYVIFEKGGGSVDILVTDDTGRVAEVAVDKETKQAYALNTGWSDYVAGTRIIDNKGKGRGEEYADL
jgi:hypothetical protein